MSFEDNREFWQDFIAMYHEKSCLWDIKSKQYRNKQMRNAAYECLIEKSKELFANANKEFVIKKIASLRSSFRRQVRRINGAKKSGSGTEDIPECTLWYFDLLSFLLDQEEVRVAVSSLDDDDTHETESLITDHHSTQDSLSETPPQTPQSFNSFKRKHTSSIPFSKKKEHFLDAGIKALEQPESIQKPDTQEMSFGKNVGQQLEGIHDRQKFIAQKLISDTLFYAKLNLLQDTSTVTIAPPTNNQHPYMPPLIQPGYASSTHHPQHSTQYISLPQQQQRLQQYVSPSQQSYQSCIAAPQSSSTTTAPTQPTTTFSDLSEFLRINSQQSQHE